MTAAREPRDAYDLILNAIDIGTYRPGERLVESELAERFGVSRTPVREALQRLETQGLLRRDGRSLIVASLDHNQMAELYEVRAELEGLAARLAAKHAGREEVRPSPTGVHRPLTGPAGARGQPPHPGGRHPQAPGLRAYGEENEAKPELSGRLGLLGTVLGSEKAYRLPCEGSGTAIVPKWARLRVGR